MKNILLASALVLASLSTAALADATGIGIGNAGASAVVTGGDSFNLGGSVGAAECANAMNFFGIGGSMSDRGCELVKSAIHGYQAGMITKGEARAIYFAGVKDMGVTLRYPGSEEPRAMVATAPSTPAANTDVAPDSNVVTIRGLASCRLENGKVMVSRAIFTSDQRYEAAKQECAAALRS